MEAILEAIGIRNVCYRAISLVMIIDVVLALMIGFEVNSFAWKYVSIFNMIPLWTLDHEDCRLICLSGMYLARMCIRITIDFIACLKLYKAFMNEDRRELETWWWIRTTLTFASYILAFWGDSGNEGVSDARVSVFEMLYRFAELVLVSIFIIE